MLCSFLKTWMIIILNYRISQASQLDGVTSEVFGDETVGMFPIAIGDYDSDKLMDTVFLSNNSNSFQIYFGFSTPPFLRPKNGFYCDLNHISGRNGPRKIIGLSFADFTGDGVLDILVTLDEEQYVSSYVFRGDRQKLDCNTSALPLNGTSKFLRLKQEPLIVDANGDMIADLFGEPEEEHGRRLWVFQSNQDKLVKSFKFKCGDSECLPMSRPHSNAFADLTGDFSPELIVVSCENSTEHPIYHLELYSIRDININNNEPRFSLFLETKIQVGDIVPARIGSLIIMDIDQTGKVVPCIPYCSDLSCRKSGLLVLELGEKENKFKNLEINFSNSGQTWGFMVPEPHLPYAEAISLRVGDFNLDGYPDLIGTLVEVGSSSKENTRSVMFYNIPCSEKNCSPKFLIDFDLLSQYNNSVNAIFYDINDNGLLDIVLLQKVYKNITEPTYKLQVVLNAPKYDGYFLKWMMTSGLCHPDYCPPYGAVVPGASMNYSMMNQKGDSQVSKSAQFFRSSFFPMDLPFVVVGTGSSPNFIDTVWIGKSPSQHWCLVQKWRQIIPNSHLVVIPYSNKWELKHFLTTNKKGAISTLQALLLILFINGVIVFLFWFKEKKEDRRNVQMSGSLNFIRLS